MPGATPTATVSKNSFIQNQMLLVNNPNSCIEEINLCFPVCYRTDVKYTLYLDQIPPVATNDELGIIPIETRVFEREIWSSDNVFIGKENIDNDENLLEVGAINSTLFNSIGYGQCFNQKIYVRYAPLPGIDRPSKEYHLFTTPCFQKIADPCWTSKILYVWREDSFDFLSEEISVIRLPFYLTQPQYPVNRTVFKKSNGEVVLLNSRVSTEYTGITEYMPKEWHEKLIIALEADEIAISMEADAGVEYQFKNEGNYEIECQKFMDYPTAPAKFKLIKATGNEYRVNSNCS